jgi:hypothetical protein
MAIIRINELPSGSGNLTDDDLLVFMDDPSGSANTKNISLNELKQNISTNINNSGNNRILTSDGTNTGIDAETNLVFDGSLLSISGDLVVNSGTFTSLNVNGTGVSLEGHTHSSSEVTDFNSSVSGLLPTINNPGNNRLLTSDGSSYGIIAQDKIVFDANYLDFGGTASSSGISLTLKEEVSDTDSGNRSAFLTLKMYGRETFGSAGRIQFERYRGTEDFPLTVQDGDFLGTIRFLTPNPEASGLVISGLVARMAVFADDDPFNNGYTPTRLTLNTSSGGENRIDNNFTIFSDNRITTNCSLAVDEGLSSPTPIYSLGIVSGNTAISYAIDKQVQTLTLNGTSVNFTQGTGWDVPNKSLDVILEITANSTTTVAFDSNFITDVYNPFPVFIPGKYLVLLRSMGSEVVQAHYIGEKTN